MSHASKRFPSYRQHKPTRRAVVTIDGRDIYLGGYNTPESRKEYDRIVAEWMVNRVSPDDATNITVVELATKFMDHAASYYRDADGNPTGEHQNFRDAVRVWLELYSDVPVTAFGPNAMCAVRERMIQKSWCRNTINSRIGRIRWIVKWAVGRELVPPDVLQRLQAVESLAEGRSDARESDEVRPVQEDVVDATLPFMPRPVAAMVRLQLLTAMRPGEVCVMRGLDLDMSADVWEYKPAKHKNAYRGHDRIIYLGDRAKEIVREFLQPQPAAYLFSPAAAEAERRENNHAERRTPLSCGNLPGDVVAEDRARAPGDRYDVHAYRRAIARACDAAFPPPEKLARKRVAGNGRKTKATRWESPAEWRARLGEKMWAELEEWRDAHQWHPHQLRHTAGTRLRKAFGLPGAQLILGHKTLTATQIYAEKDAAAAHAIAKAVG